MRVILSLLLSCSVAMGWSKDGTTYTTDGSQSDVTSAISDASAGDTVSVPAGSFTWGASASYVSINKAITLQGAGTNTVINISSTGGTYTSATVRLTATGAVLADMQFVQSGSAATTAISGSTANGWRVTGIDHVGAATQGYFLYYSTYGLIDNCTISGGSSSNELIFGRGPTDSWQTASSMGTTNAVYVEDCTFYGSGYVCDANSNARMVVRFNLITGASQKVDGHGKASNNPARGVRHMEVYNNHWTDTTLYTVAIEMRGGTGRLFNNVADISGNGSWFYLTEYGSTALWPNFTNIYQTPDYYPVDDQIGVGIDPKTAASEPMYLWNNLKDGADWALTDKSIPAAAITAYGSDFAITDIVGPDRDFFKQGATFDGSSGVGVGTKAQMEAITGTLTGVGFWVTDEGYWDTSNDSPSVTADGQLYVWNGSSWELDYTPLVYPHPMIGTAATVPTAVVGTLRAL